jgi:cytidine deaminase
MQKQHLSFEYEVYGSAEELNPSDAALLEAARKVTGAAYAPYSQFNVGAVAKLANGETISGTNQENASYPVTICAERVLLSAASVVHPNVAIETMAISYNGKQSKNDKPVSPCGMCRQALAEYEGRMKLPIRLILSGMSGSVYIINSVTDLLPFSFGSEDLNGK